MDPTQVAEVPFDPPTREQLRRFAKLMAPLQDPLIRLRAPQFHCANCFGEIPKGKAGRWCKSCRAFQEVQS